MYMSMHIFKFSMNTLKEQEQHSKVAVLFFRSGLPNLILAKAKESVFH